MSNKVLDGIMGLCVADALGVPVEFTGGEMLRKNPVTGMRSYGTYNQPAGTWSDDTSMTLCLADSLSKGLDYNDIMKRFIMWFEEGKYTPHGEVFDVGNATRKALMRFSQGKAPLECGGLSDHDNGNGSLMRILPIAYYLQANYGTEITENDEAMAIIHNISSLTHAHKRSLIACGIYALMVSALLQDKSPYDSYIHAVENAKKSYDKRPYSDELVHFKRILTGNIHRLPEDEIQSSGYVVHTFEASIWCMLNSNTFTEAVLKAVNLGDDTDTTGIVTGGLAGIHYGIDEIPEEWINTIARKDDIGRLFKGFVNSMKKNQQR